MADRGDDGEEAKTPLVRLESVTSNRVKSSNAEDGLGDDSRESGQRYSEDGGGLEVDITIATTKSPTVTSPPNQKT